MMRKEDKINFSLLKEIKANARNVFESSVDRDDSVWADVLVEIQKFIKEEKIEKKFEHQIFKR